MAYRYYDLVEQKSTTTGTGGYVMSDTVDGRRPFSVVTNGHLVPYGAVDDAGGFEFGVGTWNSGTSTLARTLVLSSSNSNAAVNWTTGERRVYITPHTNLMGLATVRHNIGLTSGTPTTGDDSNDGYGIGSLWVSTFGTTRAYICLDASVGSADWQPLGVGAVLSVTEGMPGFEGGHVNVGLDSPTQAYIDFSDRWYTYPAPDSGGFVHGKETNFRSVLGWLGLRTTNATPDGLIDEINDAPPDISNFYDGVIAFEALVVAAGPSGERKAWKVSTGVLCVGGSYTVGTVTATELIATAGSTSWDVDVQVITSGGAYLALMVTGQAATTIDWYAQYNLVFTSPPSA